MSLLFVAPDVCLLCTNHLDELRIAPQPVNAHLGSMKHELTYEPAY